MNALVWLLLAVASVIAVVSAIGVLLMRDPYQRIHFLAPPSTLGAILVAAAVVAAGEGAQACLKAVLVAVLLTGMNGVVTHATARAFFTHDRGRFPPAPEDGIPTRDGAPGQGDRGP